MEGSKNKIAHLIEKRHTKYKFIEQYTAFVILLFYLISLFIELSLIYDDKKAFDTVSSVFLLLKYSLTDLFSVQLIERGNAHCEKSVWYLSNMSFFLPKCSIQYNFKTICFLYYRKRSGYTNGPESDKVWYKL